MKKVDPKVSEYMSGLAKRRKNPYTPFKDPEYARQMGLKSAAARKAKSEKGKEGKNNQKG